MSPKQLVISRIKKLTNHPCVEILTRGNAAIWSAFHAVKKEILIPEEGGWLTYFQYPEKLKLKTTKVKTQEAVLDLKDLEEKSKTADALVYQNPGGYFAEQPIKEIYQICQKNHCLVILDVSGGIGTPLCDGKYADILVSSFGEWKLVEAKAGGFISCQNQKLFQQLKPSFKILEDEEKLKVILEKIESLPTRIKFLTEKRKKIIADLKDFEVVRKEDLGFVVIVRFKDETEKKKLLTYCQKNGLEGTECPRYIRINQPAISIEVKRLF